MHRGLHEVVLLLNRLNLVVRGHQIGLICERLVLELLVIYIVCVVVVVLKHLIAN